LYHQLNEEPEDESMNSDLQLADFARLVREQTEKVNAAKGKQAEQLQMELSVFIGQQMQSLMAQGLSVTEIQNAVRAAVTDIVPQTYAPDIDESDNHGDSLNPPVSVTTYFLPMDENVIADFTSGKLNQAAFLELLFASPDIIALEMTEGIDLVLSGYGKIDAYDEVTCGGEIVAGPDGEAFMPEHVDVREQDGSAYLISDPMVFKTAEEVAVITVLLSSIDEQNFCKKADIKKLIKSGWLDGYDKRSVKKEAAYIISALQEEYISLRNMYEKAAKNKKGMLIFVGYEGDDDEFQN
jgi:hypothetical protein